MYSRERRLWCEGRISVMAREGARVVESSSSSWDRWRCTMLELRSSLPVVAGAAGVGVKTTSGDLRELSLPRPIILLRRASRRLISLDPDLTSGSWLVSREMARSSTLLSRWWRLMMVFLLPGLPTALEVSVCEGPSDRAMQSSVRLRHMLSAFLRSCRSTVLDEPATKDPGPRKPT